MAAFKTAPAAIKEPRPKQGVGRTAPAVETVSGVLVDTEGRVTAAVDEGAVVISGTDAVEGMTPDEGAISDGGTIPED